MREIFVNYCVCVCVCEHECISDRLFGSRMSEVKEKKKNQFPARNLAQQWAAAAAVL
jgi:hypothetical protein